MIAVARREFVCAFLLLCTTRPAASADPLAELMPLPARQLEKRSISGGANDEMVFRGYRGNGMRPSAALSPDGRFLLVSMPYLSTTLWDLTAGRAVGNLGGPDRSEGTTVAFSPDGKHLLTVGWSGGRRGEMCPVTLWDAKKREKIRSLDDDVNDTLFVSAAFSPDGKTLAFGGGFNRRGGNIGIHFWDVATGDEIRRIDGLIPPDANRRISGIAQALTYSPDGRTLAILADGKVLLLETASGKVRARISVTSNNPESRQEMMNEFPTGALAFTPDGRTLAVGGSDGSVRRIDLRTGRELPPLSGHTGGILSVGYTADGKSLLTYGSDQKLFTWAPDVNSEWRPKRIASDEKLLDRLWETLRTDDPIDLYGCLQLLVGSPDVTIPFLRSHLTAVPTGDSARIEKLVADLQKPEYNERKKAAREIREIGVLAVPALRQAMERNGTEVVQRLLNEFESLAAPREQLRTVRALEVLERIGSDQARALLADLAKGAPEAALTVEAKAALERATKGKGGLGADSKLEALWESLGGDDSATAFQAARYLAARAETAVPFLAARLRDLAVGDTFDNDPKRVAKLLADLDSEDFETREKALKGLKSLGKLCEPDLRKVLAAMPSPEVKRQIEDVLADVAKQAQSAELLRVGRTLEVLEWINTPAARKAVEAAAKESRGQWLRDAAAASLRRYGW